MIYLSCRDNFKLKETQKLKYIKNYFFTMGNDFRIKDNFKIKTKSHFISKYRIDHIGDYPENIKEKNESLNFEESKNYKITSLNFANLNFREVPNLSNSTNIIHNDNYSFHEKQEEDQVKVLLHRENTKILSNVIILDYHNKRLNESFPLQEDLKFKINKNFNSSLKIKHERKKFPIQLIKKQESLRFQSSTRKHLRCPVNKQENIYFAKRSDFIVRLNKNLQLNIQENKNTYEKIRLVGSNNINLHSSNNIESRKKIIFNENLRFSRGENINKYQYYRQNFSLVEKKIIFFKKQDNNNIIDYNHIDLKENSHVILVRGLNVERDLVFQDDNFEIQAMYQIIKNENLGLLLDIEVILL